MKYSVESVLKDGTAVLVADDGERLKAERKRFELEPREGMVFELVDGVFLRDERAQDERKKEAAALLDALLEKGEK